MSFGIRRSEVVVGVSADVEMVRPALGEEGVYGVEGATLPGKWGWRVGFAGQYERAPVLVITEGEVTGQPVTDRVGGWAGFSLGLGRRVALQAVVPVDWQTGDDPTLAAPGGGFGDPRLGARWGAYASQLLDATIRADLYLPVGRREAWLGEETVRAAFGASGALKGNFGAVLLDVGLMARPLEVPQPRLDWGPSLDFAVGVRGDLSPTFSVGGAWVGRAVLAGLAEKDGELASELLASAHMDFPLSPVGPHLGLTAGGGAGVQAGVGVPTYRGFLTATFSGDPPKRVPKPKPVVKEDPPPPDPVKILEEEIPGLDVPPPPPPPMARIEGDEIVIRDQIQFKENSAELLPVSKEVVEAIAEVLAGDGRIAHLAIEGHSSEEGDLVYNWDLSDRRARAVWEALLLEGVSPQRMSWRGLGEVVPAKAGTTGVHAEDRRVVFRITRRLVQGEALPTAQASATLPWNGEAVALDTVVIPAPPPPPKSEVIDATFFDDPEEEEK